MQANDIQRWLSTVGECPLLVDGTPLTPPEQLIVRLIGDLGRAQMAHRYDDANSPQPPSILRWIFSLGRATRKWLDALREFHKAHGLPESRDPLPLSDLWPRINPPQGLAPNRIEGNDLSFDGFLLAHRRVSDDDGCEMWYTVGAPTADQSFRCIVWEYSGRWFCSTQPKSHCDPPSGDDFSVLRIHSKACDLRKVARGDPNPMFPTVMSLPVPGCYGPWQMLTTKRPVWDWDESIVDA